MGQCEGDREGKRVGLVLCSLCVKTTFQLLFCFLISVNKESPIH